jgi:uncharacterized protein with HEPN domain
MKNRDDTLYVEQMLDAIRKINDFIAGVDFDEFAANNEKQSATILQFVILGELAKKLSDAFKSRTAMPWKQIAGLRDRAVHDYYSLDIEDLWQTIKNDLPSLELALKKN